jgi:hypothetical protein
MANQAAIHCKYLLATQAINFASDTFKIILMASGFNFNRNTHKVYADVSANELATNYGYTQNTKVLTGVAVTEDDTNEECSVIWGSPSWVASGGALGPVNGAIILDATISGEPIIGFIDFGQDYTQVDGGTLTVANPEVDLI